MTVGHQNKLPRKILCPSLEGFKKRLEKNCQKLFGTLDLVLGQESGEDDMSRLSFQSSEKLTLDRLSFVSNSSGQQIEQKKTKQNK